MEGLEIQRKALAQTHCDWYGLFDDDRWLEPTHATTELPTALASDTVDMYYANSVFLQDSPTTYNPARAHHSPLLWKALAGDHFPAGRMIQATEIRHDDAILTGRIATLKTPLLDYGTMTATERSQLFDTYAKAGKLDPYTRAMVAPNARLSSFPTDAITAGLMPDAEWRDLYSEYHAARKQT
jgi:hypothetical protein